MATSTKKDKFYTVLKNIFIGARIEGNSGYVNLMRIKNKYYQDFKGQLATDIDKKLDEVGRNFEEEFYNKLYTFFKKYFSESGSIYFSYTPLQEKVYERIYRDDKDVMLFWKTNMLYYVKTERLYQNMDFQDEDNRIWYHFDVSELEHKKNNEKKELIFEYANSHFEDNKREIFFKVKYSKNGSKTKIEDILKKVKKSTRAFGSYKEQGLKRALGIFRKQSEVDYFINKNAKEFLQEQFSLWIKTYIFDDDTIFEEARLKQLKALRDIAYNIIDLVSQFEDELVKIWNKPKFAHSSNFVITLDKIADKDLDLLKKILASKGIEKQIKEWQELGMCNDKFKTEDIFKHSEQKEIFEKESKLNKNWQYLPLDTKYFKDLEYEILALFDDLDNQLDGWLIHSENYQALNTIKHKFYKKIKIVTIDPPYNTGNDGFSYLDNFKDSSWLTMMHNRLEILNNLLQKEDGVIFTNIDENEFANVYNLFENEYSKDNVDFLVWEKSPKMGKSDVKRISRFKSTHENIIVSYINKKATLFGKIMRLPRWKNKYGNPDNDSRGNYKAGIIGLTEENSNCESEYYYEVTTPTGIRYTREWFVPKSEFKRLDSEKRIYYPYNGDGVPSIKIFENEEKQFYCDSILIELGSSTSAKQEIENILGFLPDGSTPKPTKLIKELVRMASYPDSIILDFFSGLGTMVHSIYQINNEIDKESNRKYIAIELDISTFEYSLIRTKKNLFRIFWENGKVNSSSGFSGFFKYYELEQYEEALRKTKYEDKGALPKDIYHQYLFFKDLKLTDEVVKLDDESRSIKVDLTKLHSKIDMPETLSFLTGKFIKQILKDKVVFADGSEIEYSNIDYRIVKPLIWW